MARRIPTYSEYGYSQHNYLMITFRGPGGQPPPYLSLAILSVFASWVSFLRTIPVRREIQGAMAAVLKTLCSSIAGAVLHTVSFVVIASSGCKAEQMMLTRTRTDLQNSDIEGGKRLSAHHVIALTLTTSMMHDA